VYQRVVRLVTPDGSGGTAFTLDQGEVQYLVTAEHLVAAHPAGVSVAPIGNGWEQQFELVRLPGVTGGSDIAVFRLDAPITPRLPVEASFAQIVYTQDVYFLGFPYGLGLQRANIPLLPFVKKGILSASVDTPKEAI